VGDSGQNASGETWLSRQPILDSQRDLFGYELNLWTSGRAATEHSPENAAMLVCATYAELGVRSALGCHKAFLRIDPVFLQDDAIEALPAEGVVLQLALESAPDEASLERCRVLRERRYLLALAAYDGLDEQSSPFLSVVHFIRIDVRGKDARQLLELAGPLARLPIGLLAHGVETPDDFARARDAGFRFFQGYFFARPEIVRGRRLTASQTSLIRLINLTAHDTDSARIEEAFKRNPALAVKLLALVNSVAYCASRRIGSLRQAIQVLGYRQLRRWLYLLLLTPNGKAADVSRTPLLQMAALRARMMELLIDRVIPGDTELAGQAVITGLMSMMPAALGLPAEKIFDLILLEREIVAALKFRAGLLGRILALIECYDVEDAAGCARLLAGFAGLDRNLLNASLIDALRWINAEI
jgi:EAL and modified HD-GYP domain-containing signal transduction protein